MANSTNASRKGANEQTEQATSASKPEPKPKTETKDYFLKIDGVNGESVDSKHSDW